MRQDSTQAERTVVLASGTTVGSTAQPETTVVLPKLAPLGARLNIARRRIAVGPVAGRVALASIALGALLVVLFATARRSPLVPHSGIAFPGWEAGPLHGLLGLTVKSNDAISLGFSAVLLVMLVAYGVAVAAVRTLSTRTIVIWIVAMHAILLMSPPLQLTDLFNYLGYARLGGVHHINPYTHGMGLEYHDPVFRFTTWHHLRSPYGYLFSAITYPIAMLPLPVAYWVLKVITVLLSLTFIWLVWKCAKLLGRDPRFAVLFVAANPVYLIYAIGGFHNDFFMLVPSTAAILFLLQRRDRSAGAAVMLAVFVKFTAVLLLPFLLIAAKPAERRLRVLAGAVLAAIPLVATSLALFGPVIPNLQDQSTLLTDFSIPNIVGIVLHVGGGTPLVLTARQHRLGRHRPGLSTTSRGLDRRCRVVDARVGREPRLAGAVVRDLGAAARSARHERAAASCGRRAHRVPCARVLPGDGDVPGCTSHRPAGDVRGSSVAGASAKARAIARGQFRIRRARRAQPHGRNRC